ncbi:MAG: histidine phosphatase family protein [Clostridiales bacterium]|nr:MAG: histidine phosphatase family protein [Clostridiales bacterium]
MTTVYLIRHAQAEGNEKRLFQGHYNGAVSEMGWRQLDQLAEYCRDLPLGAVYSSPLTRAVETAKAVNRYHGLPLQLRDGLIEINGGDWEGKPWDCFPVDYPEQNRNWEQFPWLFEAPNGETMRQVYDRIVKTVLEIVRENPGKTVAIVSHGCAIRNFLTFAKGLPVEGISQVGWCDNTAISKITFDAELHPTLVFANRTEHLAEETKTFARQRWWEQFEPKTGDA